MVRTWIGLSFCVGCWLLSGGGASAETVRPGEYLLPNTTAGFLSITNVDQLDEHWNKTQLGHLAADPVMEPFSKDMRRQLEQRFAAVHRRLGIGLDDLKEVTGGEFDLALIRPAPASSAMVILIDVTGHLPQANAMLEKLSKNLIQQKAKKTQQVAGGITLSVFDVPPDEFDETPEKVIHFLAGDLLVAADDLGEARGIIARLAADRGDSLADVPAFQAVMKRCRADKGEAKPQARWFAEPLGYAEASRAATPEDKRRKGKTILELLQNQGFSAIQGVGGFVDFDTEGFELVHRTTVYAPSPETWQKSMKMLVFPNSADLAPQPWVPRDVATYTTLYVDIQNGFNHFGPLFDELFGDTEWLFFVDIAFQNALNAGQFAPQFLAEFTEHKIKINPASKVIVKTPGKLWVITDGKESFFVRKGTRTKNKQKVVVLNVSKELTGIWEQVLQSLRTDPAGPQLDLKDLVVHLGQRVTMLSDYELPITTTSERLLFAVEAVNPKEVAAAIEKLMHNPGNQKNKKHVIQGHVVWEVVEEEDSGENMPPVVALPPLGGRHEPGGEKAEEKQPRLLPHAAVTVANGNLFVASHLDFLRKVLEPIPERERLDRSFDYRLVEATAQKVGAPEKCAWVFSRTDEEYRPTYEMIKQGKLPEGEMLFAKLVSRIFNDKGGETRPQKIEGKNLPDYATVRPYLGPAGMVVTSEPQGWFFKGFTLKKESQ